jgi:hypothetical protein
MNILLNKAVLQQKSSINAVLMFHLRARSRKGVVGLLLKTKTKLFAVYV